MILINTSKNSQLKILFSAIIFLITATFFTSQPIDRSVTISSATAFWIIGLLLIPIFIKNGYIEEKEKVLYLLGFSAFLISVISWLNSDYYNGVFSVIEPDLRFLLFPLTVIAVRYSNLTFRHLSYALLLGSIAYTYITIYSPTARVSGDENAVTFGNGAMLLAVITSCLAYFEKNRITKIFIIIAAVGYFYASYKSGTRGSFLALPPLTLLFLYFMTNKMRFALIFLLAISVVGLSQTYMANRFFLATNNFINFFEEEKTGTSTGQRLSMWEAALCFHRDSPLLGKGPHQYKNAILDEKRTCKITIHNYKGYYSQAHSFYFNSLATVGLIGLSAMLAFFIYLGYYSWSLPIIAKVTITATLLTFLSYGITVDLFFHRYMADKHLTLLGILLGLALNHQQRQPGSKHEL